MPHRDIVVIGGSAGAVEGVIALARELEALPRITVFVSIHVSARGPSALPRLLARACGCLAAHPSDGDEFRPGAILVAPPDRHLLVKKRRVRVVVGPRENGHRPAIDPMFRSAARSHGARVIAVVLSGNLDDGSLGLRSVVEAGGRAIVQDPEEALYAAMPANAHAATDGAAEVLELRRIAARIGELSAEELTARETEMARDLSMPDQPEDGRDIVEVQEGEVERLTQSGTPSGYTCPECHGSLWEIPDRSMLRFRCRVGHAFTASALSDEQDRGLEAALWVALRAIEENSALASRLLARAAERGHVLAVQRFTRQIRSLESQAQLIRGVLDRERGGEVADGTELADAPASAGHQIDER